MSNLQLINKDTYGFTRYRVQGTSTRETYDIKLKSPNSINLKDIKNYKGTPSVTGLLSELIDGPAVNWNLPAIKLGIAKGNIIHSFLEKAVKYKTRNIKVINNRYLTFITPYKETDKKLYNELIQYRLGVSIIVIHLKDSYGGLELKPEFKLIKEGILGGTIDLLISDYIIDYKTFSKGAKHIPHKLFIKYLLQLEGYGILSGIDLNGSAIMVLHKNGVDKINYEGSSVRKQIFILILLYYNYLKDSNNINKELIPILSRGLLGELVNNYSTYNVFNQLDSDTRDNLKVYMKLYIDYIDSYKEAVEEINLEEYNLSPNPFA